MQNQKNFLLNVEAYEAPKCEIIEVQNEGVLCNSTDASASNDPFDKVNWGGNWDN